MSFIMKKIRSSLVHPHFRLVSTTLFALATEQELWHLGIFTMDGA